MQQKTISRDHGTAPFRLRLLQTTDLHMHLLPFDYGTSTASSRIGLANLIPQIKTFQADTVPTLLFDTGDFLQGCPLADFAMHHDSGGTHPIAQVFNALKYDAVALGNHDFDYGIAALEKVIDQTDCPVLSANVAFSSGAAPFPATAMLQVPLAQDLSISVGVIGLTTPVVGLFDTKGHNLLTAEPVLNVAQQTARDLRDNGADLVIALCHFGIDPDDRVENIATQIAGLADIDVVMAGHTHETFPSGASNDTPYIDRTQGTIHGTPTVMAGAFGQHLGVVELDMSMNGANVAITGHEVTLITPQNDAPAALDMLDTIQPVHDRTMAHMTTAIAQTTVPFSTAFSLVQPDLTQYLLSCARQLHIADLIAGTPDAALPILSTAAPFRTGSRSDPADFIALSPGPITRTDVAAIYPFHNASVALRRTATQIKDWLEDAALLFHHLTKGVTTQNLIDPRVPPYRFDTIFGLTYQIDVTAPAGHRISAISYKGKAVSASDVFVLVTSSNRLNHGPNVPQDDIICVADQSSQDILSHALQLQSPVTAVCPQVWDFTQHKGTKAQFLTSIDACPSQTQRRLQDDGITPDGFRQFTIDFAP